MTTPSVGLLIKGINWLMILRTLFSHQLLRLLLFLLLFFTLSAKPPRKAVHCNVKNPHLFNPSETTPSQSVPVLKGLSYEIDFKNVDEN